MKTINLKYLSFFACLFLLACNPDDNPLVEAQQDEYEALCGGFAGGDFDVSIDNNDWSTSCTEAVYSETITEAYEYKLLYIYAYNHEFTYFSDSDIEMAWIIWAETTVDGQTTVEKTVAFYKGFYDYSRAISDPDYELEDLEVYASEYENPDDVLNISVNENSVSGNINMTLFEEESENPISINGSFSVNMNN